MKTISAPKMLLFVLGFLLAAGVVQAQPDYAPAIWNPVQCGKYYTSGNGHKLAVIHDMEGYYASSISYLNRCDLDAKGNYAVQASIHYCVNGLKDNSSDSLAGEITQCVREANYAWHAICLNKWSIGTEHEGFVSNPAWYTKEQYIASAGLQRHICDAFGIPKDRNHIVGHNEWQNSAWVAWMKTNFPSIDPYCNTHTDPGIYWDWNYFMDLITKTNVLTGTYWDVNGATAGSGATPNGIWDNTTANWSSNAAGTGTPGIWTAIDNAIFAAGSDAVNPYTVTVKGTQKVFSLTVRGADVTFNDGGSGKLLFTGIGSYYSNYVAAGRTATFNVPFQGNGFPDKWGPGIAVYNKPSSGTGYFSLNEGGIAIGDNNALSTNRFVIGDTSGNNPVIVKAASSAARTIANRLVFNANVITFDLGGDLTFTGAVDLNTKTSTLIVNNNTTFNGTVTNTAGLTKAGTGTLTLNGSDNNTYGGVTTVSAGILKLQKTTGINAIPAAGVTISGTGTLQLSAPHQIADTAPMTLSGGVFNTAGFTETLGTLKLSGNSRIDLGFSSGVIRFAASSGIAWSGILTVSNWNGSIFGGGNKQLYVGTTSSGLSVGQLNQIQFVNPAGFAAGTYSAKILSNGEIVPVAVPPAFVIQPKAQGTVVGSNVTFSALATGTGNLFYQWRFNAGNLFNETNSTLVLNNIAADRAGNYSVVVTNIAGSITSTNALLSIFDSAAARFDTFSVNAQGGFEFNVSGVPGYNYVIQSSSNLVEWNPVWTNVSPFTFTATNSANSPSIFYRAVYQQ